MSFSIPTLMTISPILSMITTTIQRKHILTSLLALESMILMIALISLLSCSFSNTMEMFMVLIILTFGACEASLGLACLVSLSRSSGNDMIASSSIAKC